ncbi:dihydrodipicolinate synthase family protein [Alteromonas oceanisediminis]|uniref:dihydrodipicolinate synthase family protein n=1 Tax=Alteromonas oceanisediminis TaxID=2836180 RepID=UPI001BDAFEE5|nr:dihydrodipicolinate synthase family protein [Alteromonas oceanisediminis]MBT0587073.1 dihydrodipicolinate synthase family protein [Alteromonas oceanisediminis]
MKNITLNAYALTPVSSRRLDTQSFARILTRLRSAKVDCIGILGSTGCGHYFCVEQRKTILEQALIYAEGADVLVGVSASNTYDVLTLAEHAQKRGAASLLVAPSSYHPLSEDEVLRFYQQVTANTSIPICIYENTLTTQFSFSLQLLAELTDLPYIGALKISSFRHGSVTRSDWIRALKSTINPEITIGLSGDPYFASALTPDIGAWHSVIAGIFPEICVSIVSALKVGQLDRANSYQKLLNPLLELYKTKAGSVRVTATAAEALTLCHSDSLPLPLEGISGFDRVAIESAIEHIRKGQQDLLIG